MATQFSAVLDACVLWPASLRDTLLRLAETPAQYHPKWSNQIWEEVTRNLQSRRKLTDTQIEHLTSQVRKYFPEAYVEGYEQFIPILTNDEKDRHVVAVGIKCQGNVIVTSNLKDFPEASLKGWDIEVQHPDEFLVNQYYHSPEVVVAKLHSQARKVRRELPQLLRTLQKAVPAFAETIAARLDIEISVDEWPKEPATTPQVE